MDSLMENKSNSTASNKRHKAISSSLHIARGMCKVVSFAEIIRLVSHPYVFCMNARKDINQRVMYPSLCVLHKCLCIKLSPERSIINVLAVGLQSLSRLSVHLPSSLGQILPAVLLMPEATHLT